MENVRVRLKKNIYFSSTPNTAPSSIASSLSPFPAFLSFSSLPRSVWGKGDRDGRGGRADRQADRALGRARLETDIGMQ